MHQTANVFSAGENWWAYCSAPLQPAESQKMLRLFGPSAFSVVQRCKCCWKNRYKENIGKRRTAKLACLNELQTVWRNKLLQLQGADSVQNLSVWLGLIGPPDGITNALVNEHLIIINVCVRRHFMSLLVAKDTNCSAAESKKRKRWNTEEQSSVKALSVCLCCCQRGTQTSVAWNNHRKDDSNICTSDFTARCDSLGGN